MACQPENSFVAEETTDFDDVDNGLQSYFNSFENEARMRGQEIDLSEYNLTASIEEIHEDGVAGTCSFGSNIPNTIVIDRQFWINSSPNRREMVVFHELGHCVLGQGHRDDQNQNGICLSIMNSGLAGCSVAYNSQNKDYYLDELFGAD